MTIRLLALLSAALFTGAAAYISFVEHPARLRLDDGPLLQQWQPSYSRALPLQSGLALIGGLAALVASYGGAGPLWALGGALLLANWPFTLVAILPVNRRLMAMSPSNPDSDSRSLITRWGRLHSVRSALGAAAVVLFALAETS